MSIIASIIFATNISIVDLSSGINFAPIEDTEYGRNQTNECKCIPQSETVVTNEPFASLFDMQKKVEILWAAHTNELENIRRSQEAQKKRKQSAVERVKENAKNRKRRSAMGKSSGGVK